MMLCLRCLRYYDARKARRFGKGGPTICPKCGFNIHRLFSVFHK